MAGSPEAEAGRRAGAKPAGSQSPPQRFRFADLTIDLGQRKLQRGEVDLELPRLSFDLIATLVSAAPNSLSIDELMDRVWAGTVVSPATVAKRVELLRETLGDDPRDPRYIALVRGFGYRLIPEVEAAPATTAPPRRWPFVIALIAAGIVIVAAVTWLVVSPEAPPEKSVAVLPFDDLSDDAGDQAFADGLTEELSHELARSADLKVSGRYSTFQFRDRDEDIEDIAETLGVAHLLTGSVRRSGEQLRITSQLVHAASGRLLWSENYDRTMESVIDVQKEIARNVATRLRIVLGEPGRPGRAAPSPDPEAYALYLKARGLAPYGSGIDLPEAQRLLELAVQIDPEFAPAWNLLASVHGRRMFFDNDPQSPYPLSREEGLRTVRGAVARALAIDPESSQAFAVLGGLAWVFEGDARKAAPLIEKAVNLDPANLESIAFAAEFAKFIGRLDEALALETYVVDRDPLCTHCRFRLFRTYYFLGRFDDAERQARILNDLRGGGFDIDIGLVQLFQGDAERALETFESMRGKDYPGWWIVMGRALALHDLGQHAESNALIDQFIEGWGDTPRKAENIAQTLAYVGRIDEAFDWLDRSLEGQNFLQVIYPDPLFGNLHDDPRWHELLERIGRAPEQTRQIQFSPNFELEQ